MGGEGKKKVKGKGREGKGYGSLMFSPGSASDHLSGNGMMS